MRLYFLLLFFIFLILPSETFSFESDITSVITPLRLNIKKEKSSAVIHVITNKQLERKKAFFIEEALRDLPGVYVQSLGTPGEQTFARIRGADVDQTLVLIDGTQMNSPWNGAFDFADLTVDNVGKIEVLKGNQSALYGSDALGGVINIITKKGRGGLKSVIKAGSGNMGTFREEFHNQRGWKKFNYSISASRTDSSGQRENDNYENSSFSGRAELNLSDKMTLAYMSRYIKANKEIAVDFFKLSPTLMQSFLDKNWTNEKRLFLNNMTFKHNPFKWWSYTAQASILEDKLVLDNRASPELDIDYIYTQNVDRFTIGNQHNFSIVESDTISLGVEYKKESVDRAQDSPSIVKINKDRDDLAFYIQNMLNLYDEKNYDFSLTAGLRVDKYSDFGSTYNPKISSSYKLLSTGTKIKGSWGTGFKSPSIQELYEPRFGNPDLKPEKTQSYEIGLEQQFQNYNIEMELIFFYNDFKDLIEKNPTDVNNVGKAKTEGVEISAHYSPSVSFDLSANYTYQKAENKITGEPLRRPENIWNFNIFYQYKEKLDIKIDINLVGQKPDDLDFLWIDGTLLEGPVKGHKNVNIAFSYLVKRWSYTNEMKSFAKINNLLDQDYFENKGFKAPGISFFSGLNLSF